MSLFSFGFSGVNPKESVTEKSVSLNNVVPLMLKHGDDWAIDKSLESSEEVCNSLDSFGKYFAKSRGIYREEQ